MFTLKLTDSEINIISVALVNRPYGEVKSLIDNLQQQIDFQRQPTQETGMQE